MTVEPFSRGITREQKMGVVLLLVFAVLVVGLGMLQMRNTIYGPFVIRAQKQDASVLALTDEKTRLQQIDTDHDGLSDYEELEFYHTSPYLPDTDSDGVLDKAEVDRGTDPNCREGTTCLTGETALIASTTAPISPLLGGTPGAGDVLGSVVGGSQAGAVTQADVSALLSNPAALRDMLRKTGKISEEELGKIDDATLLSIVQKLVQRDVAPSRTDEAPIQ